MSTKLVSTKSLVRIGNIEFVVEGVSFYEPSRAPVYPIEDVPTSWTDDIKVQKFSYEDDSEEEQEPLELGDCYD